MSDLALATDGIEWDHWERLLQEQGVVIDRPRGFAHPKYPDMVYPLDYGYVPGTTGGDGEEVDAFVGTGPIGLRAMLLTSDTHKGDREIKLLWNMTDEEMGVAMNFLSRAGLRVALRLRPLASEKPNAPQKEDGDERSG